MAESGTLDAYAQGGDLLAAIEAGLAGLGKGTAGLRPEDLAAVDEFHLGGRQATRALAARLVLAPGMRLLDIGSGLGGPARYFAAEHGCDVTGIDATPAFVNVAATLTARVGLAERVRFVAGSAMAMSFPAGAFDGATVLHVGMNIADKAALFAAVRRVLRPGGFLAIFDVMATGDAGALAYPMPWAMDASASFVEPAAAYRAALERAGFRVAHEAGMRETALEFFARMRARTGPAPLGLHLLMGETAGQKLRNLAAAVEQGVVAPVEMIARV